ncbi:MAG: ribosomal protein S18-alanine N-acetyltransferase [Chloroflexi bacterium]|nr:ribosomal protein S18-alanine N-acetyltransferase [Chloroflexota bacterium]
MSYYLRRMRSQDIAQVAEIDREAFSTQWPPLNFQQELRNRLAHYIVVCDDEKIAERPVVKTPSGKSLTGLASRLKRLFGRQLPGGDELSLPSSHYIVGFVGFWAMADEAHITSIAVREAYRRQGLGELLLMPVIDLARELKTSIVTLEVRTSNAAAQRLYDKYGFIQVGVRRGYYTDNGEDGLIMSIQDITLATFQAHLEQLKQEHSRKWGIALSQITR